MDTLIRKGTLNFKCVKFFKLAALHSVLTVWHTGILKKKQLSPIIERNGFNRIHNELCDGAAGSASPHGSASPQGSACSERTATTAKASLPEQLNGIAVSIKAGTVDGDSSGSE